MTAVPMNLELPHPGPRFPSQSNISQFAFALAKSLMTQEAPLSSHMSFTKFLNLSELEFFCRK